MQKNERGPLSHQKIKCSFLDYFQLVMISQAIGAKNVDQNAKNEKDPLSHQKIKCSFLDYIQLVMIGQAIRAKNINRNAKKQKRPPKSSKNQMFIHFWIMFNFWWLTKQSEQKMLTKMQKNERGSLSHWKIKCSFLDYVQLLMIGRVIWAKNVDWNAKNQKRPPKSLKNQMFIFVLGSTSDDQPSDSSKKCWPNHKKQKRPPKS